MNTTNPTATKAKLFSNDDLSKYELISEEQVSAEKMRRRYRYGALNITLTSNNPSEKALKRAAKVINQIAIKHVNRMEPEAEITEDVGRLA